jgi:hypothetical protein
MKTSNILPYKNECIFVPELKKTEFLERCWNWLFLISNTLTVPYYLSSLKIEKGLASWVASLDDSGDSPATIQRPTSPVPCSPWHHRRRPLEDGGGGVPPFFSLFLSLSPTSSAATKFDPWIHWWASFMHSDLAPPAWSRVLRSLLRHLTLWHHLYSL